MRKKWPSYKFSIRNAYMYVLVTRLEGGLGSTTVLQGSTVLQHPAASRYIVLLKLLGFSKAIV
jgi:hypothetical protein